MKILLLSSLFAAGFFIGLGLLVDRYGKGPENSQGAAMIMFPGFLSGLVFLFMLAGAGLRVIWRSL